ncbi:MAG: tripartite tricarboxylate transporter substrate binding protein [Burkholderiales bacterium]|nr:tripartite tricarboxylate transporter substrate binding protein [Burkholderiales bacterium]
MKSLRIAFIAVTALIATPHTARASETYPARTVRIIVPFAPGGFVDFTARLVAPPLAQAMGQQFVVDNRPGAGGIVGAEYAARATPDGYTLVIGSAGTHSVNQSLYPKLPYNVLRDFYPVARLTDAPSILTVHPSLPVKTVKDLIGLARQRPGQINYASAGAGTSTHLAAVLFESLANVKMTHIAFKGGGPAVVSVLSGETPVTFATAASVTPHIGSGRLRAIAVTSGQRSAVLPGLPTIAEGGLQGYEMLNWLGLFAPTATPKAIIERLNREALKVVAQPEVVKRFNSQGAEPSPLASEEFAAFVKSEIAKWGKIVAATGMKAD